MQYQLNLKPTKGELVRLQPFIAQATEAAGITGKQARHLRLAVEEAVANVINYSQCTAIALSASVEEDRLALTIDDDGVPFDPTEESATDLSVPADERPPGGLGIILMHQMTDSLSYERIDGHNVLTLGKKKD